jgi:hypothetical protein
MGRDVRAKRGRRAARLVAILMAVTLGAWGTVTFTGGIAGAASATGRTVAVAADPAGGAWSVTATGIVTPIGSAPTYGDLTGVHLNQPIVGMAATPSGNGYWLVASDGGIFSFGDATFHGSTGNLHLNQPIVGMAADGPDGYWLVASDGGIFSFGDATFHGSATNSNAQTGTRTAGMAPYPAGYWLVSDAGAASSFGTPAPSGPGAPPANTGVSAPATTTDDPPATVPSTTTTTPTTTVPATTTTSTPTTTVPATTTTSTSTTTSTTTTSTTTTSITTLPGSTTTTTTDGTAGNGCDGTLTGTSANPLFGVLGADAYHYPGNLTADADAGLDLAVINIGWDDWEPTQPTEGASPVFDQDYISAVEGDVAQYRADGFAVVIDVGLQYAPGWVSSLADGQLEDQNGDLSTSADFEYSQAVRTAATAYIDDVVGTLCGISSYRVGLSASGEMLYPEAPDDQWWAYTASAQGDDPGDLPSTVTASPMPGWVPGHTTWDNATVTTSQVQGWYDWYLGALTDAHLWEITTFRQAGFNGTLEYVMPGLGALPDLYQARINDNLADETYDPVHTMNTGAVWWEVLPDLPTADAVVDISSVDDTSGAPEGNACQTADATVELSTGTNAFDDWSDTRYLSYLANRAGIPTVGENPGQADDTSPSALSNIMALVSSCGLTGLQYAFDDTLNDDGTSASSGSATVDEYAAAIAAERS